MGLIVLLNLNEVAQVSAFSYVLISHKEAQLMAMGKENISNPDQKQSCLIHFVKTLQIYLTNKDNQHSFTFICIYLMLNLIPGHKFLFLEFLLGYLFLLCNFLFWFRHNLLFFSKDHFNVAGRAHIWVDPTMSSVSSAPHLGGFVHLDMLNDQRIYI